MAEANTAKGSHAHAHANTDDARITPSKILRCKRGAEPSHIQKASMLFSNVNFLEELEDQVGATVQMVSADDYCHTCGISGKLVICEMCPKVFHFNCVNPPLHEEDDDDDDEKWYCANCKTAKDIKATWERFPRIHQILKKGQANVFAQLLQYGLKCNPMEYNFLPPRRPPWGPFPSESPPPVELPREKKAAQHTNKTTQPAEGKVKAKGQSHPKRARTDGAAKRPYRSKAQKLGPNTGPSDSTKQRRGPGPMSDPSNGTESPDAQVQRIVQNSVYRAEARGKANPAKPKHRRGTSAKGRATPAEGLEGLRMTEPIGTQEDFVQVCMDSTRSVHARRKRTAKKTTQQADEDAHLAEAYEQHVREVKEGATALMAAAKLLETTKAQKALAALPSDVIALFKEFRDSRTQSQ